MDRFYVELARSALGHAQADIKSAQNYMIRAKGLDREITRLKKSLNALRNLEDILGTFLENDSMK